MEKTFQKGWQQLVDLKEQVFRNSKKDLLSFEFRIHDFLMCFIQTTEKAYLNELEIYFRSFTGDPASVKDRPICFFILNSAVAVQIEIRNIIQDLPSERKHTGFVSEILQYSYFHSAEFDFAILDVNNFIFFNYASREILIFIQPDLRKLTQFFLCQSLIIPTLNEVFRSMNAFLMHSSGVCLNDQGILFVGQGGSAKTTLCLKLIQYGFKFLGDDLVLVSKGINGLEVHSFPIPVHVTESSINYFQELTFLKPKFNDFISKIYFDIDKIYPQTKADHSILRLIIFPVITLQEPHSLYKADKKSALHKLIRNSFFVTKQENSINHFDLINEILDQCDLYVLNVGKTYTGIDQVIRSILN